MGRAMALAGLRTPGFWTRLGRHELRLLVGMAVSAGLILAFALLAGEVIEGETAAFDRAVLMALRVAGDPTTPLGPPWLHNAARDITALGSITVLSLITAVTVGFLLLRGKRGASLLVLLSVGGGMAISGLLKNQIGRERPDIVPHGDIVFTASFPSGHSLLSAVVFLTLGAMLARFVEGRRQKAYVLVVAMAVTLLVGFSRIYLGVHWPTDVLAGWCVGAGWATLCWLVALWLQRRGAVEPEGEAGPVPDRT
ncbi:phosphatase PAP2 family protein [Azospirillum brasilense]|uniref:Phosphatase PAP2 family protein n=1 Tax=Azospirillum brasilense TaxID=192 RepID=A0A4D8QP15_AZOBR|nr:MULTISPECIES: phosphatase PAP2 family protein [Azospirillum]MDW7554804.1 phosphatase PAP2 family protein [Azospirillum brasilense]MDW7597143.1 phosphatase PAP2 family protein [Azospirillum brasilense]MDW7632034.1 phosphatase PAP2 family protein [Azospirillum brasilense]MDX5951923.1 phosphatase PAP2 family protein [Azospirillum brasilense]QCO10660.1 phosphatase PAP2 family protein [Azospirillum brasilense]